MKRYLTQIALMLIAGTANGMEVRVSELPAIGFLSVSVHRGDELIGRVSSFYGDGSGELCFSDRSGQEANNSEVKRLLVLTALKSLSERGCTEVTTKVEEDQDRAFLVEQFKAKAPKGATAADHGHTLKISTEVSDF